MNNAERIYELLVKDGIIGAEGSITMNLLNIKLKISEKSALGDLIQEWFQEWLIKNSIYFRTNPNSQEPPDFYLSKSNESDLLEVKVFDFSASPNFDVANFDTYVRSLILSPFKIDSKYLIFAYELNDSILIIKNIWLKNVWEICRDSDRFPINTQCKQGKITNIRPAKWYSTKTRFKTFSSKEEFLIALNKTIKDYKDISKEINKDNWLEEFLNNYKSL